MKPLYIGASAEINPDFMSRMIMKFTKCKFSHLFIHDEETIYHSVDDGVGTEDYEEFLKTHHVWSKPIELKVSYDYFRGYMKGTEGIGYSQSQYFGFILRRGFFRKLFRNGKSKVICSEYVANTLNDCFGYRIANTDWVEPKDVFNLVKGEL